jgi:two-component system sensor histidine kinase KdpD
MATTQGTTQLRDREHTDPVADYLLAVLASLLALAVAAAAERWLGLSDLSIVFMLAVVVVAARSRIGPALATALLCFLGYNFFFFEPRYTLSITAPGGAVTVASFLAAALIAGRLAARLSTQVQALQRAHHYAEARRQLTQRLAQAGDESEVVRAAHEAFAGTFEAEAWVQLEAKPPSEQTAAQAGAQIMAQRPASAEQYGWWFLPLRAAQQVQGTVGLRRAAHAPPLDAEQRSLAQSMSDDLAQAVLRVRLHRALQAERVVNETERLRSALLASVSHDLRTPLASIIGATDTLKNFSGAMDADDRHALLDTIRTEGERLDRYIQNLLDMTRLGHGPLTLARDWIGVDELIGSAVARLQRYRPDARFAVTVEAQLAPIWVHPALIEQALFNVLENAARFSPTGEPVVIDARTVEGRLQLEIRDRGPGIPADERARIFDMFYSVARGDRGHSGTGLGLAICRGMVGAHGGEVSAHARDDGQGTVIRLLLPHIEPAPEDAP